MTNWIVVFLLVLSSVMAALVAASGLELIRLFSVFINGFMLRQLLLTWKQRAGGGK